MATDSPMNNGEGGVLAQTKQISPNRVAGAKTIALVLFGLLAALWPATAQTSLLDGPDEATLLGARTVTNTGPTIVTGNVALSLGSAVTEFPQGTIVGGSIDINDVSSDKKAT